MTTAPDPTSLPRLTRAEHGRSAAPIRIIHLGIGNFTRAHQAWYTEHAPDAAQWGIAGFTGRSRRMVDKLDPQGNVYTLITSAPEGDSFEVISSISSMHEGGDMEALRKYFADPNVSIVTSTVTEAGYKRDAHGNLNVHDTDVSEDLAKLRNDVNASELSTVPARIVAGLEARRAAGAGAITILPCDNLAGNGAAFRRVAEQAIEAVDPTLLEWTCDNVAWATSMVDRITPATTDAELQTVAETKGWYDAAPVRTEPFLEWVIQGDFPKGRPAWDEAGAVITDDVEPYEQRKLWMLNGSHSTLAYVGPLFGHESVAEAIADPKLQAWVNEWWDLAGSYLSVSSDDYRAKLLERFSNPRIHHHLFQIATDGSQKLPVRIVPVAKHVLADGRDVTAPARAIAAWIVFLRRFGDTQAKDVNLDEVKKLANSGDVTSAVSYLDKDLGANTVFNNKVNELVHELSSTTAA